MYREFLFYDNESGENFMVEVKDGNLKDAWNIVAQYFNIKSVNYIYEVDEDTAECLGYDTY